MACYHQLARYVGDDGLLKFKGIRVMKSKGIDVQAFVDHYDADIVTCGSCYGCRVRTTLDWSLRCMHELQMHDDIGCFLTLTYDDEHVPQNGSLVKEHLSAFHRSLRKKLKRKGLNYKYFQCGEYGDKSNRPHYHMIIFGWYPHDAEHPANSRKGHQFFTSKTIAKSWGKGFVAVGTVTKDSCAYVAKYCQKKITGDAAEQHYTRFDSETGECWQVLPEFSSQSNKPRGIGFEWFEKYLSDVFPADEIAFGGKTFPVPRYYYRDCLKILNPELLEQVKEQRLDSREFKNLNLEIEHLARIEHVRLTKLASQLIDENPEI